MREVRGDSSRPPKPIYFICNSTPDAFIPMRECPALPSCKGRKGKVEGKGERKGRKG